MISNKPFLTISQTAKKIGVSIQTLRRWDNSGKLKAIRKSKTGNRYYDKLELEQFLIEQKDLFALGHKWMFDRPTEPDPNFYCPTALEFKTQLMRLEKRLSELSDINSYYSLVVAVSGEIGNNSFDHNLGNWPDIAGIFFGYNLKKREIVLADRGRGILQTLKPTLSYLSNDKEAVHAAFTQIASGRSQEARGNGLKFVRQAILTRPMRLFFQSGNAILEIRQNYTKIFIKDSSIYLRGCLAKITF